MPRYVVVRKCFMTAAGADGPRLYKPGDRVSFDGKPGVALEAVDKADASAVDAEAPTHRRAAAGKGKGKAGAAADT